MCIDSHQSWSPYTRPNRQLTPLPCYSRLFCSLITVSSSHFAQNMSFEDGEETLKTLQPFLPKNLVEPLQIGLRCTAINERRASSIINNPVGQLGWRFLASCLIKLQNGRRVLPVDLCPLPQTCIQFTSLSKALIPLCGSCTSFLFSGIHVMFLSHFPPPRLCLYF